MIFKRLFLAGAFALASVSAYAQGIQGGYSGTPLPYSVGAPWAANVADHRLPVNGVAPTITAGCNGAGVVVDPLATDTSGLVTGQTSATTTCTLTFGTAYIGVPYCVATGWQSAILTQTVTSATLVVTFASTANYKFNYVCFGK